MFYYLDGTVAEILPYLAVIDCGGVGYACKTTNTTLAQLKKGQRGKLYTYLDVGENAFGLYGFAMAYLLAPIVNWIEGLIRKGLKRLSKGQEPKIRGGLLRGVSILLTWAVVAYLLYLLMSVLIPQLIDSVAMLINNAESYYNKIYVWVTNLLEKNPEIAGWMETNLENYYNDLMKVLTEQVLPGAQQMLTTITGGIWTGIWLSLIHI
mgnify:CR=1 FL=1